MGGKNSAAPKCHRPCGNILLAKVVTPPTGKETDTRHKHTSMELGPKIVAQMDLSTARSPETDRRRNCKAKQRGDVHRRQPNRLRCGAKGTKRHVPHICHELENNHQT